MHKPISSFFRRYFLPFIFFLTALNSAAFLFYQIGIHIETTQMMAALQKGETAPPYQHLSFFSSLILSLLFAILLSLFRNFSFHTLFTSSLILCAGLGGLSIFAFPPSIAPFFAKYLCPFLLPVVGWGYINQIASRLEGKYYFPLTLIASLASGLIINLAILNPIQKLIPLDSSYYIPILWIVSIVFLAFAGLIYLKIQSKLEEGHLEEIQLETEGLKTSAILLATLLAGFGLLTHFTQLAIKHNMSLILQATEYSSKMRELSFLLGVGTLIASLLGAFLGFQIFIKKGWYFSVLSTLALSLLAVVICFFYPNTRFLGGYKSLLQGLHCAWIFPLVQIAFLSFSKEKRFYLQAWIFLVIAPFLEKIATFLVEMWFPVKPILWLIISAGILLIMALSARAVTRRHRTLV